LGEHIEQQVQEHGPAVGRPEIGYGLPNHLLAVEIATEQADGSFVHVHDRDAREQVLELGGAIARGGERLRVDGNELPDQRKRLRGVQFPAGSGSVVPMGSAHPTRLHHGDVCAAAILNDVAGRAILAVTDGLPDECCDVGSGGRYPPDRSSPGALTQERRPMVVFPVLYSKDRIDVPADRRQGGPAVQGFRGRVPVANDAIYIENEDALRCEVGQLQLRIDARNHRGKGVRCLTVLPQLMGHRHSSHWQRILGALCGA
jgi:hypothetical protein